MSADYGRHADDDLIKMAFKQITYFAVCLLMLAVILAVEQYTDFDVLIEDFLYDFDKREWAVTPALHEVLSPFFYEGAKRLVACIGTICVFYMAISVRKKAWRKNFAAVCTVLLSTMIVPLSVSKLKDVTNVYCPNQLEIYDGQYPYVRITGDYPAGFKAEHRGRCFPGGHVTGAFSLLSLYLVFNGRKKKIAVLAGVLVFGGITGGYQMLRGEHFLSHNLFSLFLAAIIIPLINMLVIKAVSACNKLFCFHAGRNKEQVSGFFNKKTAGWRFDWSK